MAKKKPIYKAFYINTDRKHPISSGVYHWGGLNKDLHLRLCLPMSEDDRRNWVSWGEDRDWAKDQRKKPIVGIFKCRLLEKRRKGWLWELCDE